MGWSSGTLLMSDCIIAVKKVIDNDAHKVEIYKAMIEAFEDHDWDCQYECLGIDVSWNTALKQLHPEYDRDEEDEDE